MSNNAEEQDVQVDEVVVLEKFDGAPAPENLVERIHIRNGNVIGKETLKNGRVVDSTVLDPSQFQSFTPRSESEKEVD